MNDPQRILVVDDEPQITRVLRRSLATHGYEAQASSGGEEALEVFRNWGPDLVITDLSMPDMGGLELCRRLRAVSRVPIIVLSVKEGESAKIEALDGGADDYVTKPFGIGELLARVRAALRRSPAADAQQDNIVSDGDFRIDRERRQVTVRGQEIHLSPKEFELLVYFFEHPGKVLTHRTLLAKIWGGNFTDQTEYLRVFISHLRKKIEPDVTRPRYILTDPWVGYRFQPGDEDAKHGD